MCAQVQRGPTGSRGYVVMECLLNNGLGEGGGVDWIKCVRGYLSTHILERTPPGKTVGGRVDLGPFS